MSEVMLGVASGLELCQYDMPLYTPNSDRDSWSSFLAPPRSAMTLYNSDTRKLPDGSSHTLVQRVLPTYPDAQTGTGRLADAVLDQIDVSS